MDFDLTKYLGDYGAALAAVGVIIIGWMNKRTTSNLENKMSNIGSDLLRLRIEADRMRHEHKELQYEFEKHKEDGR